MTRPFWLDYVATITTSHRCILYFKSSTQIFFVFSRVQLKKGSLGDDTWIAACGQVHKEIHKCNGKEKENRKCRICVPVLSHHEDAERHDYAKRAAVDIDHTRNVLRWTCYAASKEESILRRKDLIYFWH
jgi:hypothetical protein